MIPNPNTIITSAELHRQDLLASVARERRTAGLSGSALSWHPLASRLLALVAVLFSVRS
jgi:hypothetical protein